MEKEIVNFGLGQSEYVINGVRYIVSAKFEQIDIKNHGGNNHLNNRLKKYITSDFAELPVNIINDKMTDGYDCSAVGKED